MSHHPSPITHDHSSAVSNQGFYEFRRMLTYKEAFYGTKLELVDRWYPSSKMCSCCGSIQPMPLSERVYSCNQCGHTQDRDLNAAINLLNAPLDRVRAASAELTPGESCEPTPQSLKGTATLHAQQEANGRVNEFINFVSFG